MSSFFLSFYRYWSIFVPRPLFYSGSYKQAAAGVKSPAAKNPAEYMKGEAVRSLVEERKKDKEIRAKIISEEMAKLNS